MPRIGFAGLAAYHEQTKAAMDQDADGIADQYDRLRDRTKAVVQRHGTWIEGQHEQLNSLDSMVREGENGAPPGPLLDSTPVVDVATGETQMIPNITPPMLTGTR